MDVDIDLGYNVDLGELNYDKASGSQNLNVNEEPDVSINSVKVIKIDADPNTLNMINK